jgi:peptidoglycan/xylan/chitin deacetylase (PgdA/CDA1 family)
VLVFAGIFETRRAGSLHQKEGQVETRVGSEEVIVGCDRGERRLISAAGAGVSLVPSTRFALTFDDGPDPLWTLRVLDTLHRVEAHATFFVIAPLALKHPSVVSSVLEEGHAVEFHCTNHVRNTHLSRREGEADTREGLRALQSLGVKPRFWRPPWGVLAPWTEEVAEDFGLRLAPWSIDTRDWRGDPAREMLRNVEPLLGPGAVVLMHDGLGPGALRTGCEETVALVEPLVAHFRSMGCEPAPLTPPDVLAQAVANLERREVGA